MGGKGRRRREKNYQAAHGGGNSRLPPPPDPHSVDALPSKLRKIMSIAGGEAFSPGKNTGGGEDKVNPSGEGANSHSTGKKRKRNDQVVIPESRENKHESDTPRKAMKKRKKDKKKSLDFRFGTLTESDVGVSQRKQRKKQRQEERKKKHKRSKTEDDEEFPGHEEVRFGDVVMAPPKLTVPKQLKTTHNASQERLRLRAVEAYRDRKKWTSRPGIQLPGPVNATPLTSS